MARNIPTGHLRVLSWKSGRMGRVEKRNDGWVGHANFSHTLRVYEKVTRRKLLGKQLAGANAFAASPDPAAAGSARCAHFPRGVRNAG
jgi:hypothetical protein